MAGLGSLGIAVGRGSMGLPLVGQAGAVPASVRSPGRSPVVMESPQSHPGQCYQQTGRDRGDGGNGSGDSSGTDSPAPGTSQLGQHKSSV